MTRIGDHAVVLGASMGGLLAARALSEFYERVTVVERDKLPKGPEHRRGVPQGGHVHALLVRGGQILGELFPGILDDLIDGGVPVVTAEVGGEFQFEVTGHRLRSDGPFRRPMPMLLASRPYLEWHVRRRVRALPNVEIRERTEVLGLIATDAHDRVTGVRVAYADTGAEEAVWADLVVDATGRGARMPAWLERLGYGRPAEQEVPVNVRYSSQLIRLKPGALREKLVLLGAKPCRPTGLALFAQENDSWIFGLGAMAGHDLPTDPAERLAFATDLVPSHVVEALRDAEPLAEVRTFRFPASRWRRYDKMRRFPGGLLVFGDAVCSFNPIYGQGMSVAALETLALRDCLRSGDRKLARRFFRAAAKPAGVAWQLAAGSDLALPEVQARCPLPMRLVNRYVERYLTAAEHDLALTEQFLRVSSFLDPPGALFRPSIVARVVRGSRRHDTSPAEPHPVADVPTSTKDRAHGRRSH